MFIYAANWKMNMSFNEAMIFCKNNYADFVKLSVLEDKKIILFPEFTQIKSICDIFNGVDIFMGAQDCSANLSGAFTGQVSVLSLNQIGCSYCIIGHSEVREIRQDSQQEMAVKILHLIDIGIVPVFCVGELLQDFLEKRHVHAIKKQIEKVFELVADNFGADLYVAYEPVFAIGTGVVPEVKHIEEVFDVILQVAHKFGINNKIKFMYGGSIDENNAKILKNIKNLDGFLMGGVSLDFKKFKKIVEL